MPEYSTTATAGPRSTLKQVTAATCSGLVLAIAASRMATVPPHEWARVMSDVPTSEAVADQKTRG